LEAILKQQYTRPMLARGLRSILLLVAGLVISEGAYPAETAPPPPSFFEYRLGKGLRVGETGLTIGGYATALYTIQPHQPWKFKVSDLSLFLTWEAWGRLRLFSELEVDDALVYEEEGSPTTREAFLNVERLYGDFIVSDAFTFRFGKFLTPVGRWNLIHADPLVWTTARPLATERLFDQHAVGPMLYGSLPVFGKDLDYTLYGDITEAIEFSPFHEVTAFDNAVGGRLLYHLEDNFEVGLSYLNFELQRLPGARNNLAGLDFFWTRRKFELSGEFVYRRRGGAFPNDEAELYLQGVAPLGKGFYAVGRYEFIDAPGLSTHIGIGGLAYRPIPPLVFKVEYRAGDNNQFLAPDGFFTSVSVLF
jgi:hypothetical protein